MWHAQITSAIAQLGVPDRLAGGTASIDEPARDCNANPDALYRLLRAEEGPSPVTFMDMNMLVMLGGRERTGGEYTALLRRNGWAVEEVIPTGGMFNVIEAVRI